MAWPKGVGKGPDLRPLKKKGTMAKSSPKTHQEREMAAPRNLLEFVTLCDTVGNLGYEVTSMVQGADDSIIMRIKR